MDSHKADNMIGKIYFSKYLILRKLGEGSFGMIYLAANGPEEYALKFESKSKGQNLLETEAYIMNYLKGSKIV